MIDNQEILNWVIYKITSPTNRVYIGKTKSYYSRFYSYKNYHTQSLKQRMLCYSFDKYGFNAHKIEKIDEFNSDSNFASGKEMFWIRSYMSNYCKHPEMRGMNLTDGGDGNLGWKRPIESSKEIARKNKGKKRTQEFRDNMSQKMKGNKNGCGKVLSEEHKRILSESAKRKKGDENFKKICKKRFARMNKEAGKSVVYLSDKGDVLREFDFIYEAASFFNVTETTVRRYLKGIGAPKKLNIILKYRKDII